MDFKQRLRNAKHSTQEFLDEFNSNNEKKDEVAKTLFSNAKADLGSLEKYKEYSNLPESLRTNIFFMSKDRYENFNEDRVRDILEALGNELN